MRNQLPQQLTLRESFRFPLDTTEGRRDMVIGGFTLLLLLPFGWILNLGARLDVVHRLYTGDQPYFRGFTPWWHTFKRGCISAFAIFCYLLPATICFAITLALFLRDGWVPQLLLPFVPGACLFILAIFTLPGCMTVYACEKSTAVLRSPLRAFQRAWQQRQIYLHAWLIAITAITISLFGLLFFVVGFLFTSVWAWEVVGYAFTVAMYADRIQEN
jgi:hypothetical protein